MEESQHIVLPCPCGAQLRTAAKNAGAKVVCPNCSRELLVPLLPAAAAGPQEAPEDLRVAEAPKDGGPQPVERPDEPHPETSICPFCREAIQITARKCPNCQEYLDPALARAARTAPPVSSTAIASFVLALVSPVFCLTPGPLAFLLGLIGIATTGRGKAGGRGLAVWGTLLGLIWTAVIVVAILAVASARPQVLTPAEPLF